MAEDFNATATTLIGEGRLAEAKALLEDALSRMPADWRPVSADAAGEHIYCWDLTEFLAYCASAQPAGKEQVVWLHGSYSQACYLLAYVAVEEAKPEEALALLDRGLALERDHPHLWCEKGHTLQRMGRYPEALWCYEQAERVRAWASPAQKARALRGQGITLIDLGRLEEAEQALRRSLEVEPDSRSALHELGYIAQLRRQQAGGQTVN